MAIWVDGVAAPLTRRTTGRDDRIGVIAQRGGLSASEEDAHVTSVVDSFRIGLALFVDRNNFFKLHQHPIVVAVVAEPDGAEYECRIDRLGQFHRRG